MTDSSMFGWTPDSRGWTGPRTAAVWGLLALAVFLAFLAIWVVTPAPVHALLPFGVAVPELAQLPATVSRFDAAMSAVGFGARLSFFNLASTPMARPSSVRRGVVVGAAG